MGSSNIMFLPFRLDLDAWINEPPSESEDEEIASTNIFVPTGNDEYRYVNGYKYQQYRSNRLEFLEFQLPLYS